jgi:NAD(P)H-hydrate epimerase
VKKQEIKKNTINLIRKPESHKYDYGHVLVIAGSRAMPGAGVLCCLGAMRSGAGLVTYAVKRDFYNQVCGAVVSNPEIMFFIYVTATDILKYIMSRKVSSVVIGPGLETNYDFVKDIIYSVSIPVVLDAAGLACFNGLAGELKNSKAELIITPHLGEFSKLLNLKSEEIKNNKEIITTSFAKRNCLICVLKGSTTLVSSGGCVYKNSTGTPAMATAGSGDVLSGIISSFVNFIGNTFDAVKFAVFVHGLAGELAEADKGAAGVMARDVVENICYAIKKIS